MRVRIWWAFVLVGLASSIGCATSYTVPMLIDRQLAAAIGSRLSQEFSQGRCQPAVFLGPDFCHPTPPRVFDLPVTTEERQSTVGFSAEGNSWRSDPICVDGYEGCCLATDCRPCNEEMRVVLTPERGKTHVTMEVATYEVSAHYQSTGMICPGNTIYERTLEKSDDGGYSLFRRVRRAVNAALDDLAQ